MTILNLKQVQVYRIYIKLFLVALSQKTIKPSKSKSFHFIIIITIITISVAICSELLDCY